ncbi:hypothetical protein D3C87_1931290 [compost metagenome]
MLDHGLRQDTGADLRKRQREPERGEGRVFEMFEAGAVRAELERRAVVGEDGIYGEGFVVTLAEADEVPACEQGDHPPAVG